MSFNLAIMLRESAKANPDKPLMHINDLSFTYAQVDDLAAAAARDRLAILFLAYTGVRYGEMAALRVRNLNLLRRRALIAEAVADVIGEDTSLPEDAAKLLALSLVGMGHVAARTWLSTESTLDKDDAVQLLGQLAWRGIGGFPRDRNEGEHELPHHRLDR